MARNKPLAKKKRLAKAGKRAKAVPAWIVLKTKGGVRFSHRRRHWRTSRTWV